MNPNPKTRRTGIALALIALLAAPAACGRYGEPTRTRPGANAARSAPAADPSFQPADGSGESGEECPPEEQQTDSKARTP